MRKTPRSISPWAHLSIAFDLCDRCPLPLPPLGDSLGRIARIWRFERLCRSLLRLMMIIVVFTIFACLAMVLLESVSNPIANLMERYGDTVFAAIIIWFVGWIAAILLTYVVGFCMAPWRLRARPFMLLHAERLRRKNIGAHPAPLPRTAALKNRLAATSLLQELLAPFLFAFVVLVIVLFMGLIQGTGRFLPGFIVLPLIIPVTIILVVRVSKRPLNQMAKGIDLACRGCICPVCSYSLAGSGVPVAIKRCPECGMRFPCRLPVNIPTREWSAWRSLGATIRKRFL